MTPSETSAEAHESVKPILRDLQAKVFTALMRYSVRPGPDGEPLGGATDDELEAYLQIRHQTLSARRRELVQKGYIEASGKRRKTRSGRSATVWRATPMGMAYYHGRAGK